MKRTPLARLALMALVAVSLCLAPSLALAEPHEVGHWKAEHCKHVYSKDQLEYLLAPCFRVHDYTLVYLPDKDLNFYRDFLPVNPDGSITQMVEIPAGTNAKFEVSEQTGKMAWEFKNGKPRVIAYLRYAGNYGMIPRTVGGDGDSLDILTLGKMELRGEVVRAKVIGVLYLLDGGERDEKIIAVLPETVLYEVNSMAELDAKYPGVSSIIETWFANYKGPGEIVSLGFGGPEAAWVAINQAMAAYQ